VRDHEVRPEHATEVGAAGAMKMGIDPLAHQRDHLEAVAADLPEEVRRHAGRDDDPDLRREFRRRGIERRGTRRRLPRGDQQDQPADRAKHSTSKAVDRDLHGGSGTPAGVGGTAQM